MRGVNIAVVNATTLLSDEQVNAAGSQLLDCVREGRAPEWAADARLVFVRRGSVLPRCAWALVIMDDVEQALSLVNTESITTVPVDTCNPAESSYSRQCGQCEEEANRQAGWQL